MRSTVGRGEVAAGHQSRIGNHHANRSNGRVLADDLIEPFRPIVDGLVTTMVAGGITALDPPAKRRFARLIAFDLRIGGEISPASIATARLAQSLARAFETGRPSLAFRSEEHTS